MKFVLWAPVVIFALLSLRATVFVVYQGVSGSPFGEEEITVAGVGLRLDCLGHVQNPDQIVEEAEALM